MNSMNLLDLKCGDYYENENHTVTEIINFDKLERFVLVKLLGEAPKDCYAFLGSKLAIYSIVNMNNPRIVLDGFENEGFALKRKITKETNPEYFL